MELDLKVRLYTESRYIDLIIKQGDIKINSGLMNKAEAKKFVEQFIFFVDAVANMP